MSAQSTDDFFTRIPAFTRFEAVAETAHYQPLPEDWIVALADVVSSTQAIEDGRYKDVNMAGAGVISAVLNAVGKGDYPFVFGGDGALIALPGSLEEKAGEALAAVQAWASVDLDLVLRIAIVPMSDIRAAGLDVRVARYAASEHVSYAMFSGGGTSWAEQQMRLGHFTVAALPRDTRPDLTGLSCRWNPIQAQNGHIVSVIAVPGKHVSEQDFQALMSSIIAVSATQERSGHPVPHKGPILSFSWRRIHQEARATATGWKRLVRHLAIALQIGLVYVLNKLKWTLGRFDARRYKRDVAQNSDFRKFDDGLKMTLDLDQDQLHRLENLLRDAEERGICRYGLHQQESALMTCFVPTPLSRDHMHFIDGGRGGYAMAASQLNGKSLSIETLKL